MRWIARNSNNLRSRSGEEKPHPYIPLDLDRQADGKAATTTMSNHIGISPPNGRLPTSSNYLPNSSIPLTSHLSQRLPHAMTTAPPFTLDGGVYQGHAPSHANEWNPNTKVECFIVARLFSRHFSLFLSSLLCPVAADWLTNFYYIVSSPKSRVPSRCKSVPITLFPKNHASNQLQWNLRSAHRYEWFSLDDWSLRNLEHEWRDRSNWSDLVFQMHSSSKFNGTFSSADRSRFTKRARSSSTDLFISVVVRMTALLVY